MLQSGMILGNRYRIIETLGEGGQGRVYLAEDITLGLACAIKEMAGGEDGLHLLAEPAILKQLKHPSLPRISDIIQQGSNVYIVEEYFEGMPLQEVISHRDMCTEPNIVRWFTELAGILQYLHHIQPNPIIYRDMKPANVIIDSSGSARLVDFGIAREFKEGQESDTAYIGTRGYAAPEQYGSNQTDARTDIYSLGVTMYHVATGAGPHEPPYCASPIRQVNPQLSEGLETIIARCLQTNPAYRYQSADELLYDLQRIHQLNQAYRMAVLKRRIAAAGVLVMLAGISWGVFQYREGQEDRKQTAYASYMEQGANAYQNHNYTQAEKAFRDALAIYDRPEVYLQIARNYLGANQNQQAQEYLMNSINSGKLTNTDEVKYLMGTACFNLGNYQKAAWYLQEAVQGGAAGLGDDYAGAYRDLAVCYGRMGDYAAARTILDRIKSNTSVERHVALYISGEINLMQKQYAQAKADYQAALDLDRGNVRYMSSLAEAYLAANSSGISAAEQRGNYQKSVSLLQDAAKTDSHNILILNDLGKTCYDYGVFLEGAGEASSQTLYQEGLTAFTQIRDLGMEDADVLLNIAILDDKTGQDAEADRVFKAALQLDGSRSRTNLVYGLFLLKQKQYQAAYQYLNKTVELNQNPAEVATARTKINELQSKGWI